MKIKSAHLYPIVLLVFLLCSLPLQARELQKALRASYAAEAKGDYTAAFKSLTEVLITDSRNYFLQMRAGYLNLMLGKYPASLDAYENASELQPRAVEPAIGALKACSMGTDFATTEKWGQVVLSRDPNNYLGLSRLAYSYFARKDYAKASDHYQRVLDLYPSDTDMKSGLAWSSYYLGNKTKAATLFSEILEVNPDYSGAQNGLAISQK
jgi:tetratricopeptide (TPR) repeat protein